VGLGYGFGGGYYGYYGYPAYAYSPYGYPGYGPGYYGYDPYGYGYSAGYYNGAAAGRNSVPPNPNEPAPPPPGVNSPAPARAPNGGAQPFVDRAEGAFRSGDYAGAIKALRHATVDDPQNALITLLLGQAFFASGEYDAAAGATQAALRQLPKEQWGVIIAHYGELYGKRADYTDQLHALENAIKEKPAEPALRFLLGYHYAYLGFVTEAVDQLDAGLKLAPRDEMARQLRNEMLDKHAKPTKPPAPLLPGLPTESEDE
jgi:tetratricopeptide (TPR) repeat protein